MRVKIKHEIKKTIDCHRDTNVGANKTLYTYALMSLMFLYLY